MNINNHFQFGYTLSELMVAMVLTLMICSMVIKLFQNQQKTMSYQNALNQNQENGRLILQLMTDDIIKRFLGLRTSKNKVSNLKNNIEILTANSISSINIPLEYKKKHSL